MYLFLADSIAHYPTYNVSLLNVKVCCFCVKFVFTECLLIFSYKPMYLLFWKSLWKSNSNVHFNLVYMVFIGPGKFQVGKILDKPKSKGFFGNFQYKFLKYHYTTPALLYCYVIAVPYKRHFQIQKLCTLKYTMLLFLNKHLTVADNRMNKYQLNKVLVYL